MLLKGETPNVNKLIEKLQSIEDYREDVMKAAQLLEQKGREEGEHYKAIVIAKNLLAEGMLPQAVQRLTGLSKKEVMELA